MKYYMCCNYMEIWGLYDCFSDTKNIMVSYSCEKAVFLGGWNITNHNISVEHQLEIVKQNYETSLFQIHLSPLHDDVKIYEKLLKL